MTLGLSLGGVSCSLGLEKLRMIECFITEHLHLIFAGGGGGVQDRIVVPLLKPEQGS